MSATARRDQQFRDQPTLFGGEHEIVNQGKRSRNETFEQIAAELPEKRRVWLARVVAAGRRGVTLDELSASTGQSQNKFSGRITELVSAGLVVRTKDRRPTRAGSTAGVIVARQFLVSEGARQLPLAPATDDEATKMKTTCQGAHSMPDASTCPTTPTDDRGDQIAAGREYRVCRRGEKPTRVVVIEDPATSDLYLRSAGDARASLQRVDQCDPSATWERV